MKKASNLVAVLLVVGLIVGSVPAGAFAASSTDQVQSFVLPVGEQMDDESLAEVQGEFLGVVVAGVVAYVGKKVVDSAWDNVVEPFLEEKVWAPVREFLGIGGH